MFNYVFSCFFCDILQSLDLNLQWYLIVHIFLIDSFCPKRFHTDTQIYSITTLSTYKYLEISISIKN